MTTKTISPRRLGPLVGRIASVCAFIAGVTVLMLWLGGRFSPKVPAETANGPAAAPFAGPVVPVRAMSFPAIEPATGTIRAVHESSVGSKLLARVVEVDLKAGQQVRSGDVLVRLDDAELRARFEQAQATVVSAEAHYAQAIVDEKRYAGLLKTNAVSRQDYEKMATALRATEAELRRAKELVNEVRATLEWATVRSPMDGTVIDKKVAVGDLVMPGQVLLTLFDPRHMQLVASVREGLAARLRVGQSIAVEIEGLRKNCTGAISEIVPEAQTASRAFQVKVTGPCPAGIYTGMYGRILIPLDEERVLVVPRRAVRHIGQLELVEVVEQGRTVRRAVRSGRKFGDDVEVLSGLREGELVAAPAGPAEPGERAASGERGAP